MSNLARLTFLLTFHVFTLHTLQTILVLFYVYVFSSRNHRPKI
jgi:hypothetical protein